MKNLALAFALALGAPAQCETWSKDILPVTDWQIVKFYDETGSLRSFFARTSAIPAYQSTGETPADASLYVFPIAPPPALKKVELKIDDKIRTIDVATVAGVQVSPYYATARRSSGLKIARRDRPGTEFFGWMDEYWYVDAPWFGPTGAPRDKAAQFAADRRLIVLDASGTIAGTDGPLTGDPEQGLCSYLLTMLTQPASVAAYQIQAALTPAEAEFDYGAVRFRARRWDILMAPTYAEFERTGSYAYPNGMLPAFRAFVKADATRVSDQGAAGPSTRLTPEESRFLRCRMISAGKAADDAFLKQVVAASADAKSLQAFTTFWRAYVADELKRMVAEGAAAPALPQTPDHAALFAAQKQRAEAALTGQGSFVPQRPPPPPTISPTEAYR